MKHFAIVLLLFSLIVLPLAAGGSKSVHVPSAQDYPTNPNAQKLKEGVNNIKLSDGEYLLTLTLFMPKEGFETKSANFSLAVPGTLEEEEDEGGILLDGESYGTAELFAKEGKVRFYFLENDDYPIEEDTKEYVEEVVKDFKKEIALVFTTANEIYVPSGFSMDFDKDGILPVYFISNPDEDSTMGWVWTDDAVARTKDAFYLNIDGVFASEDEDENLLSIVTTAVHEYFHMIHFGALMNSEAKAVLALDGANSNKGTTFHSEGLAAASELYTEGILEKKTGLTFAASDYASDRMSWHFGFSPIRNNSYDLGDEFPYDQNNYNLGENFYSYLLNTYGIETFRKLAGYADPVTAVSKVLNGNFADLYRKAILSGMTASGVTFDKSIKAYNNASKMGFDSANLIYGLLSGASDTGVAEYLGWEEAPVVIEDYPALGVLLTLWPECPDQLEFHASDKDVECYAFCLPICDEDTLDLLDNLL